jgi:predicted transcriptional regulator
MSITITIRLPDDVFEWLNETSRKTGVPKARIIREQLERARSAEKRPFLPLAGAISGPADLSQRKGFCRI